MWGRGVNPADRASLAQRDYYKQLRDKKRELIASTFVEAADMLDYFFRADLKFDEKGQANTVILAAQAQAGNPQARSTVLRYRSAQAAPPALGRRPRAARPSRIPRREGKRDVVLNWPSNSSGSL